MLEIISQIEKLLTTDQGRYNKPVVLKELENGCIVCISHKLNSDGYLKLMRGGKTVLAHRLVYEEVIGPIPEGLLVCHNCDNRACQNYEHFFAGTNTDNNRDRAEKGRGANGEKNGNVKLTVEKVLGIRAKHLTGEYSYSELGREFGVSGRMISLIVNGKNWACLSTPNTKPLDNSESLT